MPNLHPRGRNCRGRWSDDYQAEAHPIAQREQPSQHPKEILNTPMVYSRFLLRLLQWLTTRTPDLTP
ncbi:MAG TPA: hypothetical protein PK400_08375 [Phycisphaerales bacterium]|nr:hypothetical protein [Phycisphaerales bacterium]